MSKQADKDLIEFFKNAPKHVTVLSERDARRFVEIITNPSEPNEALKRAAERYKARRATDSCNDESEKKENG